jgi:hypothetical protein
MLALLAVLVFPAAASAQNGTIRGRVADSTGAPIGQALVVADDADALAHVAHRGVAAAAALWTGAVADVAAPVTVLRSPADMVALVLGETAAAR